MDKPIQLFIGLTGIRVYVPSGEVDRPFAAVPLFKSKENRKTTLVHVELEGVGAYNSLLIVELSKFLFIQKISL